MKVILIKDVPGTGKSGETREVADGYGSNFLLPRGLAVLATKGSLEDIRTTTKQAVASKARGRQELLDIAKSIGGKRLHFRAKVGANERLFGSITNGDIAKAIAEQGFIIDKRDIVIEKPLRSLGDHEVTVKLATDIDAKVMITIEPAES